MKIENEELSKKVSIILNKAYTINFSTEELESIKNISFWGKLENDQSTGIKIKDINFFTNLKYITIRNYEITNADIQLILNHPSIEEISFYRCSFSKTDFNIFSRIHKKIKFIYCREMPKTFPNLENVLIEEGIIDFETIDFSKVTVVQIKKSNIINVHDLEEYDNITIVNLDGSKLVGKNGEILKDIKVNKKSKYTHKDIDKHYIK